jgi:hypothetical protein
MSSKHATELASLTSEVRRIDQRMKELAAKKATLLAVIARIRLASLSDGVLALVLRELPREALLRLRLACQDACDRVSMLLSDKRVSCTLHFERRLRVPDSLDGVRDVAACLRRFCSRFGINPKTWSLSLTVRAQADADDNSFLCSGVNAREILAAIELVAALGIKLRTSGAALGDAGAEALVLVLSTVTRLISLNLEHYDLGAAGAAALAPVLSKMTHLISLNLRYNRLGAAGAASLAPALSMITQLTSLHLGCNALGKRGRRHWRLCSRR